ncbi:histidine phosphatase family protein [Litoribrevibacter euphylliae]|uniref:Histidine phosphatase family protein n=1 Tax=Litoribrevibacter euphylliae TaxID=1834034 RepID=A0ABV7HJL9_9GAMM
MAEIFLVRHGQASFGAEDYDQLSDLGKTQCKRLGQFMSNFAQDALLVAGSLRRHYQSMESFEEGYGGSCEKLPMQLAELDEFDHENVLHVAYPHFKDRAVMVAELAKSDYPRKRFHQFFQESVMRWISGEYDDTYRESWPDFKQRIEQGLNSIRALTRDERNRGRPLIVFTSGGPISTIVRHAMGLDDRATFSLNENLANSGVTRLLSSEDRISVSYINNYSHLQLEPNLISYR